MAFGPLKQSWSQFSVSLHCVACNSRLFSLRPLNQESEFSMAGCASVCSNSLLPAHVMFWWACNSRWRWAGGGGEWLACFLHLARDVTTPTDSDLQRASACKSVPNKTPREPLVKRTQLEVVWHSNSKYKRITNCLRQSCLCSGAVCIICHAGVVVPVFSCSPYDKLCYACLLLLLFFYIWLVRFLPANT